MWWCSRAALQQSPWGRRRNQSLPRISSRNARGYDEKLRRNGGQRNGLHFGLCFGLLVRIPIRSGIYFVWETTSGRCYESQEIAACCVHTDFGCAVGRDSER